MSVTIERYRSVNHLGYNHYGLPTFNDTIGTDWPFRKISVGYDDQTIIVRAVEGVTINEVILLNTPGKRIVLIEPTLESLGLVIDAPKADDPIQDPIIGAVREGPNGQTKDDYVVVNSARLRPGEFIAVGESAPAEDRHRVFTVYSVLTRRKGDLGTYTQDHVLDSPIGAR